MSCLRGWWSGRRRGRGGDVMLVGRGYGMMIPFHAVCMR